jgi:SagB-type dehydrogenase family enzyme
VTVMASVLTERLALRAGVAAAFGAGGEVSLVAGERGQRFGRLHPGELAALRRLAERPYTVDELKAHAGGDRSGSPDEVREPDWSPVADLVERLRRGAWLCRTLEHEGRPLLTVRPLAEAGAAAPAASIASGGAAVLSRFAVLRPGERGLVLESPLAVVAVDVHDAAVVALLHALAGAGGSADGLPEAARDALVAELVGHGFAHADPDTERRDLAYRQWGHHELWFHARSRAGRHDAASGATAWAKGSFDPPARTPPAGPTVDLFQPDLGGGPLFAAVLEERASIREHDNRRPLTVEQLGEFLYRTARVRQSGHDGHQVMVSRPHPSSGALGALELYPVVTRVAGLAAGMYRYDGQGHRLERVPAPERTVRRLVRDAMGSVGAAEPPQVLIVVAARFDILLWKYETIGYSLLLKEVGALMQTMYLVATAMRLAPCAVGGGDSDLFARATGRPYLSESAVGEFILGTRPPPP